jgi:hypothetical protein
VTKSRGILPPRHRWTDSEIDLLTRLYPDTPTVEIAYQLEMAINQVYSKAALIGLKKSEAYLASPAACRLRRGDNTGAATRFKAGHETWNKGTHFTAGGRSVETRFKPGNRTGKANNLYQPIGAERISKNGYLERKINDGMPFQKRWRAVHLIIWEEANGPLPAGHAVAFKDSNKQNIALENLEVVTRAELMKRNTIHNYPKEIAQLVQLRGAVTRQINRHERKSA